MFTISRIKQHYNKELNVTGILITMHNSRLVLSMQVISELRKHYADRLFETTVSRNVYIFPATSVMYDQDIVTFQLGDPNIANISAKP